nr:type IV pili methyl-accepting chemotaxis transducer N-terminal domain-containing protein [Neisseria sp. HSC-16F19]
MTFLPPSLSARLKWLTVLWVLLALASIVFTLVLSWRLEGSAAAINDAGSLRMQTYRLGLMIDENHAAVEIEARLAEFDQTMQLLRRGDAQRPLFLPDEPQIAVHMAVLENQWQQSIRPMLQAASLGEGLLYEAALHDFVAHIDTLVRAVEEVNARHTTWLRLFQTALMTMVLAGAAVMVVVLYLWVIRPLDDLQTGVAAIHAGRLGVQVPVDKLREFAQLDEGFNQMSRRLHELYSHLEHEVAEKTRDLAEKNFTLTTLYAFSRQLNQTQTEAGASTLFLEKIMRLVPAKACSIRLLDFRRDSMDLIAHQGLPESLQNAEACQHLEECFCGQAVLESDWKPIRFMDPKTRVEPDPTLCEKSGFVELRVFKISHKQQDLGLLTLYFEHKYPAPAYTTDLLESLCNLLGLVLTNIRLAEESRQLAVLQERNLMVQGLHDSIAQSLTFLNLQVQMLTSALAKGDEARTEQSLQFIREGVQESYEDVRELLLNFRTKISRREFADAVQTLVSRFEQQTGVKTRVSWQGNGPDLSSEQQLQFIFILQESLSNIRKHAQAERVEVAFDNEKDFVMSITDNGCGFVVADLVHLSDSHVGLNIMQERALRIHARLEMDSVPHEYTQIKLTLPHEERNLL